MFYTIQSVTSHRQQGPPIERRQLVNELHELRIDLAQKKMALENLESDYRLKITDLEHKLGEALKQKQVFQVWLIIIFVIYT